LYWKCRLIGWADTHSYWAPDAAVHRAFNVGRDMTLKNGRRLLVAEIAVFGVKDDKIISETFFIRDQLKLIE